MTQLKADVRIGQTMRFTSDAGNVAITLEAKSGKLSRLSVKADKSVKIHLPNQDKSISHIVKKGITG